VSPFCRICGLPIREESHCQQLARSRLDGEAFSTSSDQRVVPAARI
jgi:hypothetical protein